MEEVININYKDLDKPSLKPMRSFLLLLTLMVVPATVTTVLFSILGVDGPNTSDLQTLASNIENVFVFNIVVALFSLPILRYVYQKEPAIFPFVPIKSEVAFKYILFALLLSLTYTVVGSFFGIESNEVVAALNNSITSQILGFFVVCIFAPVLEELIFRGFLFSSLIKFKFNIKFTVLISSAIFALVHSHYENGDLVYVFCVGVLLGYARFKTGSLVLPIAMHFFGNLYGYFVIVFF